MFLRVIQFTGIKNYSFQVLRRWISDRHKAFHLRCTITQTQSISTRQSIFIICFLKLKANSTATVSTTTSNKFMSYTWIFSKKAEINIEKASNISETSLHHPYNIIITHRRKRKVNKC